MLLGERAVGEIAAVVHHRGDDAGGAVRGRGDDLAVGGVFLIHSKRVEVDPLHGVEAAGSGFLVLRGEQAVEAVGAALHAEAARQGALGLQPVGDAFLHDVPDGVEVGVEKRFAMQRLFVGADELSDGQAAFFTECDEGLRVVELVRRGLVVADGGHTGFVAVLLHAGAVQDEAAADGVVLLAGGDAVAVGVPGVKDEAVRVLRDRSGVKRHLVLDLAGRARDHTAFGHRVAGFRGDVGRRGRGGVANQAEQRCAVGAVAHTSGGEGAAQFYADECGQHAELFNEREGCAHRAHRVRRRRTDTDAEKVNDANSIVGHARDDTASWD